MGIFGKLFGEKEASSGEATNWQVLETDEQLDELIAFSHDKPALIFKHSTRCSISSMAKSRLMGNWDIEETKISPFYLDLIAYREISNRIAAEFGVNHESPQVILIHKGKAVFNNSHNAINVDSVRESLSSLNAA